jgi:NADH-quinone oxidoreductase subunit K
MTENLNDLTMPLIAGVEHYIFLSCIIFVIGLCGIFLNRKNLITLLLSIELIFLAVNINFVAFSFFLKDISGQVFVLFVFAVAAAEIAIGLAIVVSLFRNRGNIEIEELTQLKG